MLCCFALSLLIPCALAHPGPSGLLAADRIAQPGRRQRRGAKYARAEQAFFLLSGDREPIELQIRGLGLGDAVLQ
jgi:hypothetical protein